MGEPASTEGAAVASTPLSTGACRDETALPGPLGADPARTTRAAVADGDWTAFVLVVGTLWAVPLWLGGFHLYMACIVAIFATAALGLQLMVGLAGQLSLGHAAFLGIGAYVSILVQMRLGLGYVPAAILGTVAAGLAGLLMAQLVRLSGVYFKIATFGFGVIVYQVLSNWSEVTGGHTGLIGIPAISLFGIEATSDAALFAVSMTILTIVYVLFLRLSQGRVGRAFRAIGQNEDAARAIGIPATPYKMAVIAIGCAAAGLAGTVIPHLYRFLNPEEFTWIQSLTLLIMITVGGLGSLPGAVVGALVLVAIPEFLRDFAEYKMLVYGLLLIASMVLLPRGIAGGVGALLTRIGRLRRGRA